MKRLLFKLLVALAAIASVAAQNVITDLAGVPYAGSDGSIYVSIGSTTVISDNPGVRVTSGVIYDLPTITWDGSGILEGKMTFTTLTNARAWQGSKVDLGARRASSYAAFLSIVTGASATAGGTYQLYWSPSPSSAIASDNPGGHTGVDGTFRFDQETNALAQCEYVGALTVTTNAAQAQSSMVGLISGRLRYGAPVVRNNTSATANSTNTTSKLVLVPILTP